MAATETPRSAPSASLIVVDPNGARTRVHIEPLPFRIGRQADSDLIIRDSRASRTHARIVLTGDKYFVEDAGSRHGIFVNGERVEKHALKSEDRIEFGVTDSYQLIFAEDGAQLGRLMEQIPGGDESGAKPIVGGNLAKLRAVLDVARALQTGFSTQDVLTSVVDAALTVTGAERGFLLLGKGADLEFRVARNRQGRALAEDDLRVPRKVIQRSLERRRELLSMTFDPAGAEGASPEHSVAALELRSVVCVPLVRINSSGSQDTGMVTTGTATVGVLYLDSRLGAADLAAGNRELLQTLAIEASTILENARLLEEQVAKQKIEQELNVARAIQQSLLPRALPADGWFHASGSSVASYQVGGDYFDVLPIDESNWAAVVADVSGKGVSSALLASLLQGAFLNVSHSATDMENMMARLSNFMHERTEGGKYATIFYALLDRSGRLRYCNAGHCAPIVLSANGAHEYLESTAMPVGLMDGLSFAVEERQLAAGDKIVVYSDGVTEAESPEGKEFGRKRLREIAVAGRGLSCLELHNSLAQAVKNFTGNSPQADDVTLLVLEYRPD